MKKREFKKTGLSLLKFKVAKLDNMYSIKGGSEASQIGKGDDEEFKWTWGGGGNIS